MKAEQTPAESTPLEHVRTRRRPWLVVVAVLFVAIGALLAGAVVNAMKTTTPVVVAAAAIERGATISEADLTTVEVHPDAALATIAAGDRGTVVGQTAAVDIPRGSLLTRESLGAAPLPKGHDIAAVALTPAQMPSLPLRPGDKIRLVYTPRQGDDLPPTQTASPTVAATVVSTSVVADTNLTVVNVTVPAAQADSLATIAATGRIALIVEGA